MTKIIKLKNKGYAISKELISKFGELVYQSEGVDSIFIRINFKDGSNIGFRRSENEDAVEEILRGDEE